MKEDGERLLPLPINKMPGAGIFATEQQIIDWAMMGIKFMKLFYLWPGFSLWQAFSTFMWMIVAVVLAMAFIDGIHRA